MSAVIGILNKQAIALAADSAVTIAGSDNRKIFNTANKIFTLSKYHPVGVMVYNSASFMGTPWEIIIKMYREQLKDGSFKTVEEYQKDFINYLRTNDFFSDRDEEDTSLANFILDWIENIIRHLDREYPKIFEDYNLGKESKFLDIINREVDSYIEKLKSRKKLQDFDKYSYENYETHTKDIFNTCIDYIQKQLNVKFSKKVISKFRLLFYYLIITKRTSQNYTGLIFVGYGEDEIYPQLIPVNISFVLDNKLRYFLDEEMRGHINSANNAVIRPFAQIDVINTILAGVDPQLARVYTDNFEKYLNKYTQLMANEIQNKDQELAEMISSLDIKGIVEEYKKEIQQIRKESYLNPLMNAVASLSKEDLAEMAESLIYLTYLKRRFTFEEESVGGPVDVALITKGDGFIWMKRKHYFDPELNHHFFENYLT